MTTFNYELIAHLINYLVVEPGAHETIARQGRLQLEMRIKMGIDRYVQENNVVQDQSIQLYEIHKEVFDHANDMHTDITDNKALSRSDISKYMYTYLKKLKNKIDDYNLAAESGPKMKLK